MKKYKENYIANEVADKNEKVLGSLTSTSSAAAQQALASLESLKQAITEYSSILKDFSDLSIEKSQIMVKYTKDTSGGSFGLPGVFSGSAGSYNLPEMKEDNKRIEELLPLINKAEAQKDLYSKIINRASNDVRTQLQIMTKSSADIEAYLAQLDTFTSWQSNSVKK